MTPDDDAPSPLGSARGERRPTIRDVAARAGISKSVVSRVFSGSEHVSDESRRLVLEAAESIGFRPNWVARSLAGERDDFVGILVADLHNPVFAEVVDAARAELSRAGRVGLLTSALLPTPDDEGARGGARLDDHALALFGDLRPSRLLIVGTIPDLDRVVAEARHARIVAASAVVDGVSGVSSVRGDDERGIELVVDHLVRAGHRRIAHIGGAGGPVSAVRARAFRDLMAARGLGADLLVEPADYTESAGRRAAERLLASDDPPTAIVAVNDLAAIGALVVTEEARLATGRRVAVTGYDNTFLADLPQIDLTSVEPGNVEIGREAARLLLADEQEAGEVLVRPRLIERGSSR